MKSFLVECIGTFFLVLVIGLTVVSPLPDVASPAAGNMAPLAIGLTLMVMVYAGGHLSGGHYNPAVTLAVWMRGKCPTADVVPYMLAQIAGAVAAALVVGFQKGHPMVAAMTPDVGRSVLNELLFTFALCYVVLNVATSKQTAGNSYYGLAIGCTVLIGAYAGGGISGGAYNPAVAVGITVMGLSSPANLWIYLVGCFAGGALAALVYKAVNPAQEFAAADS